MISTGREWLHRVDSGPSFIVRESAAVGGKPSLAEAMVNGELALEVVIRSIGPAAVMSRNRSWSYHGQVIGRDPRRKLPS